GSNTTTSGSNTTTSGSNTTTSGSNTTSSGTGGGTTGNHSFETALPIDVNPQGGNTTGTLVDADTTTDYYKFTGTKGERITAVVIAQGLVATSTGDDVTIIDAVATIYDAGKKQIAQNDDAWPRTGTDSQAFTVLPADGDYYLAINTFCTAFPNISGSCTNAGGVVTFDYETFIGDVDKLNAPDINEGMEPGNDTVAKASKVTYALPTGAKPGQYGISILDGTFQTAADMDVYEITVPADTSISAGQRPHAEFWVQPITPDNGTGAATNGKFWLVDAAAPTVHIAEVDQVNYSDGDNQTNQPIEMSVPITIGPAGMLHTYYFFAQHGAEPSVPVSDFYFIKHFAGTYYLWDVEKSPDANNLPALPEALTVSTTAGHYYFEGDLSTIADVDYFSVDVDPLSVSATLSCSAQRVGSGLRGAKFSLFKADGITPLGAGSVFNEVANLDGTPLDVAMVAGANKKIVVKVEAASQAATVTSGYYRCAVSAAAP
ncbi:MAG: hypothetical protein ABJE95_26290, partial [Byssovorax sp.]